MLSAQIIAHLAMTAARTVMTHLEKEGKYEFGIDKARVTIKREHLTIEKEAPEGFVYVEFPHGDLFIKKEMSQELAAEGYARELMRRVQSMRKDAGLSKEDRIELCIVAEGELKEMLEMHKGAIQEKVGAQSVVISSEPPLKQHATSKEEEIKGKKLWIHFTKL